MHKSKPAITRLTVGELKTNCYLVSDPETMDTVIVDPGDDAQYIADIVTRAKLRPILVAATHGHFDHILAAFEMTGMYGIPFAMNPADGFLLKRMRETAQHFLGHDVIEPPPEVSVHLGAGSTISLGGLRIRVVPAPGHTPGSVLFMHGADVICGDTVFAGGGIGDWRHGYSDKDELFTSVRSILKLPQETVLHPGHGEETTVGEERKMNTYLDVL